MPDRPTILYVDDELFLMQGVIDYLSIYFNVLTARGTDQALQMLESESERIDLLLFDIMMPPGSTVHTPDRGRTTGVELARIVLEEQKRDVPIVCYTVVTNPEVHNALVRIGVKEIVSKAKLPSELKAAIERNLPVKQT